MFLQGICKKCSTFPGFDECLKCGPNKEGDDKVCESCSIDNSSIWNNDKCETCSSLTELGDCQIC